MLLLKHRAQLIGKEILVKPRKRQRIRGVLHEFDLWISVQDVGIFLIECKDWEKRRVGKNDVIVFSEKMRETKAVGGYIVARTFTRDAKARARLHRGLKLQVMNQDIESLAAWFGGFHFVELSLIADESRCYLRFTPGGRVPVLNEDREVSFLGEATTLTALRAKLYEKAVHDRIATEPTGEKPEGMYRLEHSAEFESGGLIVDGSTVDKIAVEVVFNVDVEHPSLFWHYNFVNRGVSLRFRHGAERSLAETTFTRVVTGDGMSGTEITLVPRPRG